MTRHDDDVSMQQMLDHAREIVEALEGKDRSVLVNDRWIQLGITRLFEILGDAHPEIEWGFAIGMRNRLIHGYDVVDLEIIWDTAHENIPELITKLEGALRLRGIDP